MLQFQKLKISNFLSIADSEFTFQDGITLLLGENNDSGAADDNGSGKSTVAEALRWAIFGDTVRRELDKALTVTHVVRNGVEEASVILWGDSPRGAFKITRTRSTKKGTIKIEFPDSGAVFTGKGADDVIAQVIGVNALQFSNLVHLDGSYPKLFAPSTDAERKEILGSLLGAPSWDKGQINVSKHLAEIGLRVSILEREIAVADGNIPILTKKAAEIKEQASFDNTALQQYKKELRTAKKGFSAVSLEKQDIEEKLAAIEEEIASATKKAKDLVAETTRIVEEAWKQRREVVEAYLVEHIEKLEKALYSTTQSILVINHDLEHIAELQDMGKCTLCGQDTTEVGQGDVEQLEKKVGELNDVLEEQQTTIAGLQKQRECEIFKSDTIWTSAKERADQAKDSLMSIAEPFKTKEKELRDCLTGVVKRETQRRIEIGHLTAEIGDLEARIEKAKKNWENTKKELVEQQDIKTKNKVALEELIAKQEKLLFWKKGFGPKGVPSLFIELVLPAISAKIQKYADILTGGDIRVTLKAYSETQSQTVKEAIQISAVNLHGSSVYGANSAGERTRINLAVTLGLLDYFRSTKAFTSSLLVCDEVFDGLDTLGVEKALEALKEANIPSVLVISHHDHFKPLFSQVCYAVKEKGISTIRS